VRVAVQILQAAEIPDTAKPKAIAHHEADSFIVPSMREADDASHGLPFSDR